MSKSIVRLSRDPALAALDVVSYGRRGPGTPLRLSLGEVEQVARTVRRTPEVMVKVSGGARDVGGARAHFSYIDRHGHLPLITDDGRELLGRDAAAELVAEWNLDLARGQYRPKPQPGEKDQRPKLAHNIVLSMPGSTPPDALLAAARHFARETFAVQHRYAMVLHTDQRHPHVHLVVKAEHEYEPEKRLNIRKATLRAWREEFARCLRAEGIAANATPAPLRGRPRTTVKDAMHRRLMAVAEYQRQASEQQTEPPPITSRFLHSKVQSVAHDLQRDDLPPESGKARLLETRRAIADDWLATAQALRAQGEDVLAREVEDYVKRLPAVRTDRERIAAGLMARIKAQRDHERDRAPPLPRI